MRMMSLLVSVLATMISVFSSGTVLAQCRTDDECRGGRVCLNGECAFNDTRGFPCKVDTDCPVGMICEASICANLSKGPVSVDSGAQVQQTATASVGEGSGGEGVGAGQEERFISVKSDPVGASAALDGRGGWYPTPHSFQVAPGEHVIELKLSGFKTERIPVSISRFDLLVDVNMNRPVFEAGVWLTAIGAIFAAQAGVFLGIAWEKNLPDSVFFWGYGSLGFGVTTLISGVLMMVLDGHDASAITVAPTSSSRF